MNVRTPAGPPSVREIAELVARLRRLSAAREADSAKREQFLADKAALLARIPGTEGGPR